ncbi:hypothetical protein [Pseudomonas protegens]|uniref:hypothetical protein n=2 Tax=Pseudomonas protegens TaxID=380021 RepID=UPI00217EB388|nr:hypothetical protein [Pseudomonas protegens]
MSDMKAESSANNHSTQKVLKMSAVKIGKHFGNLFPKGVVQIVSPAENLNGLTIQTAYIDPADGYVNLYASEAAPASAGDANTRIIFCGNGPAVATSHSLITLPEPLFVPAGMGLWVTAGSRIAGAAATGSIAITWDLVA